MCYPNQEDELRRIELMGKTLDAVFDAMFKPRETDWHDDRPMHYNEFDPAQERQLNKRLHGGG